MALEPKRVQAIFLEAADYSDSADRALILDRECSADAESRQRIESLLKAHDQFNDFLNQPFVGSASLAKPSLAESDGRRGSR